MKRWLVLSSIGLAVFVPDVVYGKSSKTLVWNGRNIRLTAAQRVPSCAEVLSAYGAEEGDFDALARFLNNALPLTAWNADGVEMWDVTHEFIDLKDGGQKEVIYAHGTIGEHEALMKLSIENGAFVINVTRYTDVGDLNTDLEYAILQPQIPSRRDGSDLRNDASFDNVQASLSGSARAVDMHVRHQRRWRLHGYHV